MIIVLSSKLFSWKIFGNFCHQYLSNSIVGTRPSLRLLKFVSISIILQQIQTETCLLTGDLNKGYKLIGGWVAPLSLVDVFMFIYCKYLIDVNLPQCTVCLI